MEVWKTDEDVDYDMFTLSEFTVGNKYKPTTPKKSDEKVKVCPSNNAPSIYDSFNGVDEAEEERLARRGLGTSGGRGYVMQKFRGVNRSENVMPQRVLDQTERDIREVCPVGYSNELIEAAYKKRTRRPAGKPSREFRFSPTSDAANGAVPKASGGSSRSAPTSSVANDLPSDFVEYDVMDNRQFPSL